MHSHIFKLLLLRHSMKVGKALLNAAGSSFPNTRSKLVPRNSWNLLTSFCLWLINKNQAKLWQHKIYQLLWICRRWMDWMMRNIVERLGKGAKPTSHGCALPNSLASCRLAPAAGAVAVAPAVFASAVAPSWTSFVGTWDSLSCFSFFSFSSASWTILGHQFTTKRCALYLAVFQCISSRNGLGSFKHVKTVMCLRSFQKDRTANLAVCACWGASWAKDGKRI